LLKTAGRPLTAREMVTALLNGKTSTPTWKQEVDVQAAILASMRRHAGDGVEAIGEGRPMRWKIASE